ncbi:MAG: tyrosine-type recombinase/integrase [Flavobacteriales bacterium]|nr:tyrosine-type recombinase/integrase [Flavobacteriales bacterium]
MSGRIKLGKSRDSRTRGKAKIQDTQAELHLQQALKQAGDFTRYLLAKGYSSSTIKRFIKDSGYFLAWAEKENVPVENASYSDVLHFIQGKRDRVKQRTLGAQVNSLKHYFDFLAATAEMAENPASQIQIRGIKRRTLYDILKKSELEGLYQNFEVPKDTDPNKNQNWFKKASLGAKRNKVVVGLMVYQGLTVYELATLKQEDIRLREGKIFVAGSRRSEQRMLNLEAHQILDLMEYTMQVREEIVKLKKDNGHSGSLLISTGAGRHFNNTMQDIMRKLRRQNSKVTSAKQIRASVITHWLKLYNLRQVQYMAGHRYVSSTEAYLVNDLDDLQEDVNKFHPIG